jgi:dynein heavy chain 1
VRAREGWPPAGRLWAGCAGEQPAGTMSKQVLDHINACAGVFWALDGAFDKMTLKAALKKGGEEMDKFASGADKASALLCVSFTPDIPAGEPDEDGNVAEATKCVAKVSAEFVYSRAASYILLLKKELKPLEEGVAMAKQVYATSFDGGSHGAEMSPYDSMATYLDSIFHPYIASYLQVEVEADGGELSKAQVGVKDNMKRMEQSLSTVRDQYTFAGVKLNVHPSIAEFYDAPENKDASEDAGLANLDTSDKEYIKELEASVNSWAQEVTRVTKEDRDASEGSALRDVEFFTEMIGALQKLDVELERPAIKCTKKALQQGGSRFALGKLDSTHKEKENKLKLAESAQKLLADLPITQLKSITSVDAFAPVIVGLYSSKAQPLGLMEKVKRVFVQPALWTRLDDLLIALTRDFVSQLKDVLETDKPLHMDHLEMKTIMDSSKGALKAWDDEYTRMYTHLVEVWQREDITPRAGFAKSRDRVQTTTGDFRKRISEVTKFREEHVQLEKAIERVMGRASGMSGSVDVIQKMKEQYEVMQEVDWLAELGDVVDAAQMERDEDDFVATEWSKAVDRYETHVAKVEDVLNGELKKLLDAAEGADAMFRVFKKVNALFVRPAIRENIKAYQKPLVESVQSSIQNLDSQFTMQYHKSEACVMSRVRDMTDVSGAIVWARQMQRQLGVYQKQVAEILGKDWERDELGKDLLKTSGKFAKKLQKTLDDSVKQWLANASEDRQSISSQTVFEIKKASGKYSVLVNFDPKAADLLKDFRLLQGIGLLDASKHGRQLMQINWIKSRYPSYRALSDTLKTYERTVERITPDIMSLTAEVRAEAQESITDGVVRKKWTKPVTAEQYAKELGAVVAKFESTVDQLLDNYRVLNEKLSELESCPATQGDFKKALEDVQKVLNDMDLDENANGKVWMESFLDKVDAVLLGRMRKMITMWAKNIDRLASGTKEGEDEGVRVCGTKQVRSVHRIRIQRGAIVLDPPVAMARHHWLGQLESCLQIVAKQTKLVYSSYSDALGASASTADTTMSYLLEKLKPEFMGAQQTIEREIAKAQAAADMWMRYKSLWAGNSNDVLTYMTETHKDDLGKWIAMLISMRQSRNDLDDDDSKVKTCAITVDYSDVQTRVMDKYDVWIKDLLMKFADTMMAATESWFQSVNDARGKLEGFSMDSGDTMQAIEFLTAIESFKKDKEKWGETVKNFRKGEKHLQRDRQAPKLPEGWKHADGIENEWNSFLQIFEKKEKQVEKGRPELQMKIMNQDGAIEAQVKELKAEWESADLGSKENLEGGHKEMLATIAGIQASIDKIDNDYTMIGQAKEILGVETVGGTNKLESIKDDCTGLTEVWKEIGKIHDEPGGLEELYDSAWRSVDAKKVLKTLKDLRDKMKEMPSRLRSFVAHTACQQKVESYIAQNSLLMGLRSESLKERHWDQLKKKMDLPSLDLLVLGDMYKRDMLKHKQTIEKLQVQAQGEMALEEFIKGTEEKWSDFELELVNYQNKVRLIRGWDDLFTALGENLASLQSMRLSPYFKPFADRTDLWEDKLQRVNERMDIWVDVQRRWVYLETIFLGSQEIKYQLPQEHKRFMSIDNQFKGLHKEVASDPQVLQVLQIDDLLVKLQSLQDNLTNIQKALGDYLEKQRQQFARFYFVGDEDLLELIGSSKDPAKVQKHFSKMFAGISALVIEEVDKGGDTQVLVSGMVSHAALETVPFNNPINVTENPKINVWLTMLEVEMRNALANAAEKSLAGLRAMADKASDPSEGFASQKDDFLQWLSDFPSQCGLLMCQVQWTEATEKALEACEEGKGDTTQLKKVGEGIEATLSCLAGQVLVEKSLLQRKKAEAMITELVHQRTVTRDLLEVAKTQTLHPKLFQWLYYMRFYWESSEKKVEERCKIKMSDATFNYGYEYQGVVERLVQTPLSDRAYLTLTQALHYRLGGSPYGPAGTGKTETVKALGCQLGRYVLVFCCDENFDMHAMGRIFIGLCQVGAWGCFDEFNRLEERMLSAVSQQIQVIQEGLMTNGDKIDLLGRNFVPHTDMGIFVTMNPGYAGRSELPDNLKQLLRACAMTAPDRELIAEVMLYAQGFNNAEPLSCKIVPLFNLCRDQLSAQPHHDFGLRALKSVLNSAGNIKRAMLAAADGDDSIDTQGLEPEQELIIRSISETVAPKLVGGDLPLLKTLITDVFPGIKQEDREFEDLMNAIKAEVKNRHLEMGDVWVSKIIQLYQIQELHHGFMVVGPTGTGKTTAWEILLTAMGEVPGGCKGKGWVIDPKAMPKDDLYGYMDNTTREWTDGVFTRILRKIIDDTKTLQQSGLDDQVMTHWIVFDGDVDPVWVENLNSVLDDNKLLTLPNGERLALLPNIRIVFEVQDLKYATAATVSRCGMVWFSDNTVAVQDTMKHYLSELRVINVDVALPSKGGGEGEGMMDKKKALEVQCKCADAIESQIIGDASLLETALEEAAKRFTIMDFVPLQSMNAYFDLMNVGVQNVLDYNGAHEEFPLANDVLAKFIRRHSLRSIAWACGGSMKMDDRLQFGRDLISWSTEDVPDELGFGGKSAPCVLCHRHRPRSGLLSHDCSCFPLKVRVTATCFAT